MGNLARRYYLEQAPPDPKLKGVGALAPVASPPRKVVPVEAPKAEKIAKARKASAETEARRTEAKPNLVPTPNLVPPAKRGRPAKNGAEPWVEAGVSRRTWFRQQKAKS
jgi:hypothetical protein